MAATEPQQSDFGDPRPLGAEAPSIENLRYFVRNDDGTVTAIDIRTLKEFTLSSYNGILDRDDDSTTRVTIYVASNIDLEKFDKNSLQIMAHTAVLTRYQFMFARAQDACRELIITVPECLSAHADVEKLCEKNPAEAKEIFMGMTELLEASATPEGLDGVRAIKAQGGNFEAELFAKLAETQKRKLDLLPTQAKIIANEFRRLRAYRPECTSLPILSLKTVADNSSRKMRRARYFCQRWRRRSRNFKSVLGAVPSKSPRRTWVDAGQNFVRGRCFTRRNQHCLNYGPVYMDCS